MINFPEFCGKATEFAEPIYVNLSYTGDDDYAAWFKFTGYNNNGNLIGTGVNINTSDNWIAIHSVEMKSLEDDEIHHYFLIDEETYLIVFNKVLNKLK